MQPLASVPCIKSRVGLATQQSPYCPVVSGSAAGLASDVASLTGSKVSKDPEPQHTPL